MTHDVPRGETAVSRPGSDMGAAFLGLAIGLIAVLGIVYGIVRWTDSRFEGHATAPATTTPH